MSLKFAANLTWLFTEVPLLERFGRAAQAGFSHVELASPYEHSIQELQRQLDEHQLKLVLFNLPAGEAEKGEWGTLSNPFRRAYFRASFRQALEYATALGCPRLNLMFGRQVPDVDPADQYDCAVENLLWAAPLGAAAGVNLLIEPLNSLDNPDIALRSTAAAVEVIQRVDQPQVRLQYDLYHAQMTEGNLIQTLLNHLALIDHLQLGDVPGRHQPGTGEINFPNVFAALEAAGYAGFIGLEYRPLGTSEESLAWLPRPQRA
jgi:hydroxypyruvate isomerase